MIVVEANNADSAWRQLFDKFGTYGRVQDSRDETTKELIHVAIEINDPRQRVVFSRPINPAFAIAEVIWILAGSDDLAFIAFWNPRMKRYSDDGITMHGAYGTRLRSDRQSYENTVSNVLVQPRKMLDQVKAAYEALRHIPHSRQVVLQIWDSERDLPNPGPRSKDVPCNLVSHLMIRNGNLHWLQTMRSNDFVWGFPYNIIQFTTLQEIIAGWLGVGLGPYVHVSDSLHVYQRHWSLLDQRLPPRSVIPENLGDLTIRSYDEWEAVFRHLLRKTKELSAYTSPAKLTGVLSKSLGLPRAYREWIALLTAEALRRRGHISEAWEVIDSAGPFWSASWKQWASTSLKGIPAVISEESNGQSKNQIPKESINALAENPSV
jgi:thymidylate synthase